MLMASAPPKDEWLFFRAPLVWAVVMIAVVPVLVWFCFVHLGIANQYSSLERFSHHPIRRSRAHHPRVDHPPDLF